MFSRFVPVKPSINAIETRLSGLQVPLTLLQHHVLASPDSSNLTQRPYIVYYHDSLLPKQCGFPSLAAFSLAPRAMSRRTQSALSTRSVTMRLPTSCSGREAAPAYR